MKSISVGSAVLALGFAVPVLAQCGSAATEDYGLAGSTADAGSAEGETLTSEVLPGIIVRSRTLQMGNVETTIIQEQSAKELARGLFDAASVSFSFEVEEPAPGATVANPRGVEFLAARPTLAELNAKLVERWKPSAGAAAPRQAGFSSYDGSPGCDLDPRIAGDNHCMQDCCAKSDSCFDFYGCSPTDLIDFPEPKPLEPIDMVMRARCYACVATTVKCIGDCAVNRIFGTSRDTPCFSDEHQCYDARCEAGSARGFYCAKNCYTQPAPCDVKATADEVWCPDEDRLCRDVDGRKGYYAKSCSSITVDGDVYPLTTACECEAQGLTRCKDSRCPAGQQGYCARSIPAPPEPSSDSEFFTGYVGWNGAQVCDPKDTRSPCCGAVGQQCCDGACEGPWATCVGGNCVDCGGDGEACCATGSGCAPGFTCKQGGQGPECMDCGMPGSFCCDGNSCESGFVCDGEGFCRYPDMNCGARGQPCCYGGSGCDDSFECDRRFSMPLCNSCGGWNEPCCNQDGLARCQSGLSCDLTGWNRCTPNSCGDQDEFCCIRDKDDPNSGGSCNSGQGTCSGVRCRISTPSGLPDLAVQISNGPQCNDPRAASIRNVGDAASGPFQVAAMMLGQCNALARYFTCPSLGAGQATWLSLCTLDLDLVPASCNVLGWYVTANGDRRLTESNYENNEVTCFK